MGRSLLLPKAPEAGDEKSDGEKSADHVVTPFKCCFISAPGLRGTRLQSRRALCPPPSMRSRRQASVVTYFAALPIAAPGKETSRDPGRQMQNRPSDSLSAPEETVTNDPPRSRWGFC